MAVGVQGRGDLRVSQALPYDLGMHPFTELPSGKCCHVVTLVGSDPAPREPGGRLAQPATRARDDDDFFFDCYWS
jgi:hypothetical protein